MALKDDLNAAVTDLNTTSQQVIAAFQQLKTTAGSVDDATVQSAVSTINAAVTNLKTLLPPA